MATSRYFRAVARKSTLKMVALLDIPASLAACVRENTGWSPTPCFLALWFVAGSIVCLFQQAVFWISKCLIQSVSCAFLSIRIQTDNSPRIRSLRCSWRNSLADRSKKHSNSYGSRGIGRNVKSDAVQNRIGQTVTSGNS